MPSTTGGAAEAAKVITLLLLWYAFNRIRVTYHIFYNYANNSTFSHDKIIDSDHRTVVFFVMMPAFDGGIQNA